MGVKTDNLVKTTEQLREADGDHIKLELQATSLDFPAQAARTGQASACTATHNKDDNAQGCNRPTGTDTINYAEQSTAKHTAY